MTRIEGHRRLRLLATVAAAAFAVAPGAVAEAASPVPCHGTVAITGTSNFDVRTAGGHTIVAFDFIGVHDICLRDGSKVVASIAGRLVQRLSPNGDLTLRFDEVLSYGGGSLGFRGEASLSGGKWQSHVQSVGTGTGQLAGIHGQGEFWFTGPTSFADVISYVYAP